MDFTTLYQLRERLKSGAVAGTNLVREDFRLKKALDAFASMEELSPVFKRIGESVRFLLSDDCSQPGLALLDALSLCDAVLVTQAAVSVDGKREPISLSAAGGMLQDIPYSVLSPLEEAFVSSGGGRFSRIMEARNTTPHLFEDHRIKLAMIKALGASYGELADKAEEWLGESGPDIIPPLKSGFDPQGKKEMARRVGVISKIAGGRENEFYLSQLEEAGKDVKPALINALRHEECNAEILLTLVKTEKGAMKKQAHWALVQMKDKRAVDYFAKLADKDFKTAGEYLMFSTSEEVSRLVGVHLLSLIASMEQYNGVVDAGQTDLIENAFLSALGKSGKEVSQFYTRAAELSASFDQLKTDQGKPVLFRCFDGRNNRTSLPFGEMLSRLLAYSIFYNPTEELVRTAEQLYSKNDSLFRLPFVLTRLLFHDREEAFLAVKPVLKPGLFSTGKQEKEQEAREILTFLFQDSAYAGEDGKQKLKILYYHPGYEEYFRIERQLAEPLDIKWYQAMTEGKKSYDALLIRMLQLGDSRICKLLSEYFYAQGRTPCNNTRYIVALKKMGWKNFDGFLECYFAWGQTNFQGELDHYMEILPMGSAEKEEVLKKLLKQAEKKKNGNENNWQTIALTRQLEKLQSSKLQ